MSETMEKTIQSLQLLVFYMQLIDIYDVEILSAFTGNASSGLTTAIDAGWIAYRKFSGVSYFGWGPPVIDCRIGRVRRFAAKST
jgi:hypothetical protein